MKGKAILILYLLMQTINGYCQTKRSAEKELNSNVSTSLEKALKHPEKATEVCIEMYTDSVFPNDNILRLTNVEHIVIAGRSSLRRKEADSLGKPTAFRVDVMKLKKLSKLKYLNFTYCDFRKFPVELCYLDQLEGLEMSVCLVDSLPEEFGNLKSLKALMMRIDNLKQLPASMANLDSLVSIDLCNNSFKQLPAVLSGIKNLKKINLKNAEGENETDTLFWGWPYPLHVNTIDYMAEVKLLKRILEQPRLSAMGMQVNDRGVITCVRLALQSDTLFAKTSWHVTSDYYFKKSKKGYVNCSLNNDSIRIDTTHIRRRKIKWGFELLFPEFNNANVDEFNNALAANNFPPFDYSSTTLGFGISLYYKKWHATLSISGNAPPDKTYGDTTVKSYTHFTSFDIGYDVVNTNKFLIYPNVGYKYGGLNYELSIDQSFASLANYLQSPSFNKKFDFVRDYMNVGVGIEYGKFRILGLKLGMLIPMDNGRLNTEYSTISNNIPKVDFNFFAAFRIILRIPDGF